jgi:hypothetical protein
MWYVTVRRLFIYKIVWGFPPAQPKNIKNYRKNQILTENSWNYQTPKKKIPIDQFFKFLKTKIFKNNWFKKSSLKKFRKMKRNFCKNFEKIYFWAILRIPEIHNYAQTGHFFKKYKFFLFRDFIGWFQF